MSETATTASGIENAASTAKLEPSNLSSDIASLRMPEAEQTPKAHWDITQLRLAQDYLGDSQEVVQAATLIGKPRPETWFQVHPSWHFNVATIKNEERLYIVMRSLCDELEGEYRRKLLVPYVTRDGDVGFWSLNPLQVMGRTDNWTASAHRVLVAARKGWVRMRSNMRLQSYELITPKATWAEPTWPEESLESLLEAASADCINTLDHPIVRALRGEAGCPPDTQVAGASTSSSSKPPAKCQYPSVSLHMSCIRE